jgi:isopentenyl phosphate kinase
MQKTLIVIKLGGSALTDKQRIYTPRKPVISRAAKQIADLASKFSLVLVHGAGSYGHIPVKQWNLASGFSNRKQLTGLAMTKSKLLEWEMILVDALIKHGVPVIPLVASDFVVCKNGRIESADLRPFTKWLNLGCVPSIGGDIVTDLRKGFAVLSGDQLAAYLTIKLGASRLIFATDVDGIFDSNPKLNRHARLLPTLTVAGASKLGRNARVSTAPDVTGGMAGKIREAVTVASRGIPVYFVNLAKGERLKSIALNRSVPHSRIVPG